MSRETMDWLRNNILVGFTDKRRKAWWNSDGSNGTDSQGRENHFPGAVPVPVVRERLFNWQGVRQELYVPNLSGGQDDPEFVTVPDRIAISRSDNGYVMGIFKDGYVVHQYDEWLMNSIANILDDTLSIGSAGLLQNGAVGWVSVEVPENIVTPEGVEFRPFLLGITSMNGKYATMFKRVVTNVVCDNTMEAARNEAGNAVKVKHSKYSGYKIDSARAALDIIFSEADDFATEVAELSKVKVTAKAFDKFLDLYSPQPEKDASKRTLTLSDNRRAILSNLWTSDSRVSPFKGTGWGVVQLANTYEQHFTSIKGMGDLTDFEKSRAQFDRSILDAASGDLLKATLGVRDMLKVAVS